MDATFNQRVVCGKGITAQELAQLPSACVISTKSAVRAFKQYLPESDYPTIIIRSNNQTEIERVVIQIQGSNCETIIGLGTGSAIDVSKVVADAVNKPLVCIPTGLSCNVFATNKSVICKQSAICTIVSKIPEIVIVDTNLLSLSDLRYTIAGIGDVLSVYTAMHDWDLARVHSDEPDNFTIRTVAESLIDPMVQLVPKLIQNDPSAIEQLTQLLLLSGYLTNMYGSGRPESGSEHMFARAIETDPVFGKRLLHGEAVLLGILLSAELQGRPSDAILGIAQMSGLRARYEDAELTENDMVKFLITASTIRPERFSIFNIVHLDATLAHDIVKRVLAKLSVPHVIPAATTL